MLSYLSPEQKISERKYGKGDSIFLALLHQVEYTEIVFLLETPEHIFKNSSKTARCLCDQGNRTSAEGASRTGERKRPITYPARHGARCRAQRAIEPRSSGRTAQDTCQGKPDERCNVCRLSPNNKKRSRCNSDRKDHCFTHKAIFSLI